MLGFIDDAASGVMDVTRGNFGKGAKKIIGSGVAGPIPQLATNLLFPSGGGGGGANRQAQEDARRQARSTYAGGEDPEAYRARVAEESAGRQDRLGEIGTEMDAQGAQDPRNIFQTGEFSSQYDPLSQQRDTGATPMHLRGGAGALANQRTMDALSQEGPSAELAKLQQGGDAALRRSAQNQRAQTGAQTVASGNLGQGGANTAQQRTSANVAGQIMANEAQKTNQTMAEKNFAQQQAQNQALQGANLSEKQYGRDVETGIRGRQQDVGMWGTQENVSNQARQNLLDRANQGDLAAQDLLREGAYRQTTGGGPTVMDDLMREKGALDFQESLPGQIEQKGMENMLWQQGPEFQQMQFEQMQDKPNWGSLYTQGDGEQTQGAGVGGGMFNWNTPKQPQFNPVGGPVFVPPQQQNPWSY